MARFYMQICYTILVINLIRKLLTGNFRRYSKFEESSFTYWDLKNRHFDRLIIIFFFWNKKNNFVQRQ